MFHRDIQTPRRVAERSGVFLTKFEVIYQTLSRVFDISSQSQ